mgnify:CR=1 FL=1
MPNSRVAAAVRGHIREGARRRGCTCCSRCSRCELRICSKPCSAHSPFAQAIGLSGRIHHAANFARRTSTSRVYSNGNQRGFPIVHCRKVDAITRRCRARQKPGKPKPSKHAAQTAVRSTPHGRRRKNDSDLGFPKTACQFLGPPKSYGFT